MNYKELYEALAVPEVRKSVSNYVAWMDAVDRTRGFVADMEQTKAKWQARLDRLLAMSEQERQEFDAMKEATID